WERRELAVIPGRPPEAGAAPAGCRFADRCEYAKDECSTAAALPLRAFGDTGGVGGAGDRRTRCVRADELALSGTVRQEAGRCASTGARVRCSAGSRTRCARSTRI